MKILDVIQMIENFFCSSIVIYKIWGFHCGEDSRRGLMGYNVV